MRWMALLGITLAAFWGCSLDDALENAPCETNDDCLGDYTCVRTVHQDATGAPGWCRDDGGCVAGEQEGCAASGGACQNFLTLATDPASGIGYCCDAAGVVPSVTNVAADGSSAQCVVCSTSLCNGQGDMSEECVVGEPRCEAMSDGCGCRIPANQLENSECDDDDSCGEGFVCTRTAEQDEEPMDAIEPGPESGWCRPVEDPECVANSQPGCTKTSTSSCGSGVSEVCAGPKCYCCEPAAASPEYIAKVYLERSDGTAACIDCQNDCSATVGSGSQACTAATAPTCQLSGSGPCGCTPPT